MKPHRLIIIWFFFLFSFIAAAADPNHISINCGGGAEAAIALGGREWLGDDAVEGSSRSSAAIAGVDPVPYKTARLSRSQFSLSFDLSPGQKIIRFHFNPAAYDGFPSFGDLFTVEAGHYTLLSNFSASITARAHSLTILTKEYCIILEQRQHFNILFSPETSQSKYSYAFINGIEIITVPSAIAYCHGGDRGIRVVGQNYIVHLDNSTALEIVHRQNVKWGSDDGMFGILEPSLQQKPSRIWRVSVDVGFRYMVRLHLCELGLKMHYDFILLIDGMVAFTSPDDIVLLHHTYNYMVMVEGQKREGKRNISVSLHSRHEFLDKHGPFEGFEVFKLSNHDMSLASPNPHHVVATESSVIQKAVVISMLCLSTVLFHLLRDRVWDGKASGKAKQFCRCFSLAEIKVATKSFHEGFVVGKVLSERAAAGPWEEEGGLTKWAKEKINNLHIAEIVAPSLRGEISADSVATFVGVAERCVADEPKERPEMTEIIIQLELAIKQQERYGGSSLPQEISVGVEQLLPASNNEIKPMNSRRKPYNVWSTVRKRILKISKPSSCKMHLVDISAPSSLHCLEGGGGIRI
ncbi:hypothetical protein SASPL_151766 [Salvia splendens]|uniref:Malectin-like domain-containing protein n=1 Tax=Salvia splendens TaxID=180675 RepID=A0A8X8W265_SALSN|nr:hypothetical protein SASPL_151766 [Salvia splendens]